LPSLSVVIPAFNEERTIVAVLDRVRAVSVVSQIVVVDDCSSDATRALLHHYLLAQRRTSTPSAPVLCVVHHATNQGKGAAIRTGLGHATGDVVVIQDADLEYEPEQFSEMVELFARENATVVYGSRFRGRVIGMRFPNLVANKTLTFLANVLFGARITDEATCYKMFRRSVLADLPLRARRFDFCPEVTAKLLRRGHRIHEVPIRYRARTTKEGKKIRWTDGVQAIWAIIKYRFVD
jgi:glycosyltransferase involved in cell wall biosynthesis